MATNDGNIFYTVRTKSKTTSLISLHPLRTFPGTFNILIKKCLAKKCSSLPHFPRHFFHKKCLEKKCSLQPHYPRHFQYFHTKIAWQKKNSFHPHFPRHFQNVHKKCLAKKCSLHPHVPRHILYFQKKCLAKSVIYFRTSPGT